VKRRRGFTLLEMIVATTIMGVAVVGLLSGISNSTRNAARLRDYDRVLQLARLRMNDLLVDERAPQNTVIAGDFDRALTGGLQAGWRATVTLAETAPSPAPGDFGLDRIQLEIWWKAGEQRRTFALESYRRRILRPADVAPGAGR
jgi:general secretion pathway protein I